MDKRGLEGSWWEGAGGRIVREGIKGAGTGAIGGGAAGAPTGVGGPVGALAGGLVGLPVGLLKGTVKEIARIYSDAENSGNTETQEDAPQEQRQALEEWWLNF